jgi:hypothetical protein
VSANIIKEVHRDREDLARVLKKHVGIRKIVEDLYPDSAHFIYELLQNAEDTGAEEATFFLTSHGLVFEHNGRPFEPKDISGITNIGEGTKDNDDDKIGRFGVGFKAVFAYTETPHIWSPTFSFKIVDLVLPEEIDSDHSLGAKTRFYFPFNNVKKPAGDAYGEIKVGLAELAETSLLFLRNIRTISWNIDDSAPGEIVRYRHSKNHFEVLKRKNQIKVSGAHFLKFSEPAVGLEKQDVAVAFDLDFLPDVKEFSPDVALAKQFRIVAAVLGHVCVFFPAEKEVSGLRFHLHGPFVPELSRASIKETPLNDPLFEQLATLVAASLNEIKCLDLLTADLLSVLPNPQDRVATRYEVIRRSIINTMNTEPLTPTLSRSHAPAERLLQGRASMKALLTEEDLEFLVDYEDEPPLWAIAAAQKNSNVDRFLEGLAITQWDVDQLLELLCNKTSISNNKAGPPHNISSEEVKAWLGKKPAEWHQQLYSLLFESLQATTWRKSTLIERLRALKIVRLVGGKYSIGRQCFFSSPGMEHDEVLPRVDEAVHTSGRSKSQQDNSKALLTEIGVREVGEAEEVEAILKQRYGVGVEFPDDVTHKKDLGRFIALVKANPQHAGLFEDYYILKIPEGTRRKPSSIYLDAPFAQTDLSSYYSAVGEDASRKPLSSLYHDCGVPPQDIARFAESVGVQVRMELIKVNCDCNARADYLKGSYAYRKTDQGTDTDWYFPLLHKLMPCVTTEIARLIWKTMCKDSEDKLEAVFRWNGSSETRRAPSLILNWLSARKWIPQANGKWVLPIDASPELLPEGFSYDPNQQWLRAIRFGQNTFERAEEHRKRKIAAKDLLGTDDPGSVEDAKWFATLDTQERENFKQQYRNLTQKDLPKRESSQPERRAEHLREEARSAPERQTEERLRSVSVGREAVKVEAAAYLRQQYTNEDGVMYCQICKSPLPFKLADGSFYFEKVEFLRDLPRRHYQNYLALCPNHAAMYQLVNDSEKVLAEIIVQNTSNEVGVVLAQKESSIYFTKLHLTDLKTVITTVEGGIGSDVNGATSTEPASE